MRIQQSWILTCPLIAWGATIPNAGAQKARTSLEARQVLDGSLVSGGGKTFSLAQTENGDYQGEDAPFEMIRAHSKYGVDLSDTFAEALRTNPEFNAKYRVFLEKGDITGSIVAKPPPLYDIQYVVPVDIGSPPQRFYLNLDTGSADLWTFATTTYQPTVNGHTLYAPENSSTSKLLEGEAWGVRYGDGATATGVVYLDRVQVGETYFDRQAVQAAVQVSPAITADKFASGILGLGMSIANTVLPTKQKTYTDNIKDDLAEPLFTANLQKGLPGNYNFGFINKSEYKGKIGYVPVANSTPYWEISLPGYKVGDGKAVSRVWNSIVDTGTSLLLLPEDIVKDYYSQVDGSMLDQGMFVVPCDVELPDFKFQAGDYSGAVPGDYINYGRRSQQPGCYGGIQVAQGIPFAVIGDVFLKSQFVVFDIGKQRVGFAAKDLISKKQVQRQRGAKKGPGGH